MKILFLGFVFLIITISARAESLRGTIKHFGGRYVESHHIYSYYALETENKERILLPSWIDSRALSRIPEHEIIIDGMLESMACADMSRACPTGKLTKVRWMQYQSNMLGTLNEVFTGQVKPYHYYYALSAGREMIEVPSFLDAQKLYLLGPQVTIIAEKMDVQTSPQKLQAISMIKLEF